MATESAPLDLLRQIDEYLNAVVRPHCDAEVVGPFTVFLNRTSDHPYLSYARPTAPLDNSAEAVLPWVRDAFRKKGRTPRWEFIEDLHPRLPDLLVRNGYDEPDRFPLMVLTPDRFRPESAPGVLVRALGPEDDLAPLMAMQRAAFGEEAGEGDDVAGAIREMIRRGTRMFEASLDGRTVAGGAHSPIGRTTEVAGIGVHPDYRRRGLGGAISSAAVEDALRMGCDCLFLTAGNDPARRLYARLGFETVGTGVGMMERAPQST